MRKRDVILRALQRIQSVAADDRVAPADWALAETALEAVFAEMQTAQGMTFEFDLDDDIPGSHFGALADLLAAEVAPDFNKSAPVPRATAIMRLRAANSPYARDFDLNDDGDEDEEEIDAVDAGRFF